MAFSECPIFKILINPLFMVVQCPRIEKVWQFLFFKACAFRLPWKLWRHLEGGKMEEFGLEAKRHLLTNEASEILARQYAEAFEGKVNLIIQF